MFDSFKSAITGLRAEIRRRPVLFVAAMTIVGAGLGMAFWGPPETIVEHEVGPVRTVYVNQPHPPIKVVEVSMPQSCKDSIAFASFLVANAATMADSATPLMDAMKEATIATVNADKNAMNEATSKMNRLNSATLKSKMTYGEIYPQFQKAWETCSKEMK